MPSCVMYYVQERRTRVNFPRYLYPTSIHKMLLIAESSLVTFSQFSHFSEDTVMGSWGELHNT